MSDMYDAGFRRYVALGDSQTEGLWDGDDTVGVIGFADRLAAMLNVHFPGLQYANLAVRGRRVRDVLVDQLPPALDMQPDLVTVCAGMNDVTRPGRAFDRALGDLDALYATLAGTGTTVVTTTFPDVARLLPVGRLVAARLACINDLIRHAAAHYDFRLVDLYDAPSMIDPGTWSPDRVHGSTRGHILFAEAAAEAIGLPSSNHEWAQPAAPHTRPTFGTRAYAQLQWTRGMMMPFMWRYLRGKSRGAGRMPKRPQLADAPTLLVTS